MQVAFLGGGNMARALIKGMLGQGMSAAHIRVGEPMQDARGALQDEFGVQATASNEQAVAGAALVVLAVKPQQLHALLAPLRAALQNGQPLLRAMPNRAALVGAGITALYAEPSLAAGSREMAERVLAGCGRTVWVGRESELDIVTAMSGSGPAYFFLLAEQLANAGRALGLEAATAELLARETLRGAGALLAGPETLAWQREAVTSKGGTTAAALAVLEERGFGAQIAAAVSAAARRSEQLAEQFGRQE